MKKQEFAEHLKALRIKKGLSQKELASILSVSQQNIAQYESGKRNPKYETIVKIAAALDVDIYDLLISGDMTPREAMAILKTARIKENLVKEIQQYRAIGTVEECREAVDKQKPKKCVEDTCPDHTHYKCPSCGQIELSIYKHGFPRIGRITKYCENCGQALIDEN